MRLAKHNSNIIAKKNNQSDTELVSYLLTMLIKDDMAGVLTLVCLESK